MIATNTTFVTDTYGKTISAIVPINEYNELLRIAELYDELEMLEDIKAYREAKNEPAEYEPFDVVMKRIEENKKNGK